MRAESLKKVNANPWAHSYRSTNDYETLGECMYISAYLTVWAYMDPVPFKPIPREILLNVPTEIEYSEGVQSENNIINIFRCEASVQQVPFPIPYLSFSQYF